MLNVVLVEPEIPSNTGNIGRTCVLTGARLHLVGPLGFQLDQKSLRRAGLAYWGDLDLRTYDSWDEFLHQNPRAQEALQLVATHPSTTEDGAEPASPSNIQRPELEATPGAATAGNLRTDTAADNLRTTTDNLRLAPATGSTRPTTATQALPRPCVHLLTKAGTRTYAQARYADGDYLVFGKESTGLSRQLLEEHPGLTERIPMLRDDSLPNAPAWHRSHEQLHPELQRDVCGNFVDPRSVEVASLNLSNSVAIVLYEALRQLGFPSLR